MEDEDKPFHAVTRRYVTPAKVAFSREMRREMTHCEALLWDRLRRKSLGVNFRRQQIIDGYIADFYCHPEALVVEVDGPTYDPDYDRERDRIFSKRGIRVLRVTNDQVKNRPGFVISLIKENFRNKNTNNP